MKTEEKKSFRQNKKRNSGLLYEFLTKHISNCIVEDKKEEANKALEICKKFFSEGSPLKNELNLFQSVLNSKVSSVDSMHKIVEYACKYASLMNSKILDEEKSKLIKEINYSLNNSIYDYKIHNYINFSSLQTLFNESRNKQKKLNEIDKVKFKDSLVSRLMESKHKAVNEIKINPIYNNTLNKILVNKFHEKYDSKLTENQKKFLIQYTSFLISNNKKIFTEFVSKEASRILEILTNIKDPRIKEDVELNKKITECKNKYENDLIKNFSFTEKQILEFLQFISLADEVAS